MSTDRDAITARIRAIGAERAAVVCDPRDVVYALAGRWDRFSAPALAELARRLG